MRLRYVHRGYFPSRAGAELMTQCLAEAMVERGHAVTVECASLSDETAEWMATSGVRVDVAGASPGAATERPDVVHAVDAVWPHEPMSALAAARRWSVPFVFTPASAEEVWTDRPAIVDVCRQADAVLALTSAEKSFLIGLGVAPDAVHLVGQGPHLVGDPDPAGFRNAYTITGPMVLFLGRKMRSKGYRVLLEAAQEIWDDHPDTHFVFIGPRVDPDCQEVFAKHADFRIVEIPDADEVTKHSALAACDLVCLPSTVDVFPLVFVEAWACRKPVVTAAFLGGTEVVRHGWDGLVVPATASGVADAVSSVLANPSRLARLGANGYERVRTDLNWKSIAGRVEQVYQKLIHHLSPKAEALQCEL